MKKIDYALLAEPEIYQFKAKEVGVDIKKLKQYGVKLILTEDEATKIIKSKTKLISNKLNLTEQKLLKAAQKVGLKFHTREGGNGLKFKLRLATKVKYIDLLVSDLAAELGISTKELKTKLKTVK